MVQWLKVCLAMQGTDMGFIPSQGSKIARASGQLSPYAATKTVHGHKDLMCMCTQSCRTLCDPMDCNPPGSYIHGTFQTKILERVAISFSKRLEAVINIYKYMYIYLCICTYVYVICICTYIL